MSRRAFLIGCNYIGTNHRLFGCINDCLLIQKMLISNYNFNNEDIIFMRDDIYNSNHTLYPSCDNIKKNLDNMIADCFLNKSELLYIHYSGHGSFLRDISSDEIDGNDEFIVPADFFVRYKRITDDELYECLKTIPAYTKCFMVFDCCCSGSIVDLPYSYSYQNKSFIEKIENQKNDLNNKSTIISLSACRDEEFALDVTKDGIANGAMSLALYSVLNSNKWICNLNTLMIDIYQYLLLNKFNSQRPIISCNKNINLNNNYFNFKEPNPESTILYIDNVPITINAPAQPAPAQPAPAQPAPAQPAPAQPAQPQTTTNILSIQNLLEMCIKNDLFTKQQLKDLIAKITA